MQTHGREKEVRRFESFDSEKLKYLRHSGLSWEKLLPTNVNTIDRRGGAISSQAVAPPRAIETSPSKAEFGFVCVYMKQEYCSSLSEEESFFVVCFSVKAHTVRSFGVLIRVLVTP